MTDSRSHRDDAAIDEQLDACNVAALVRGQKEDGLRDLLREYVGTSGTGVIVGTTPALLG
ncbi:Hypothetical protein A7982_04373 [Minicystis rosea]|nr:Hypothetical protein A7982_04373 [Minicystis rosea]